MFGRAPPRARLPASLLPPNTHHRDVLPRRHGQRARDKAGEAGQDERAPVGVAAADAQHQRRGAHQPVVGAQHRRAQPGGAVRVVRVLVVVGRWRGAGRARARRRRRRRALGCQGRHRPRLARLGGVRGVVRVVRAVRVRRALALHKRVPMVGEGEGPVAGVGGGPPHGGEGCGGRAGGDRRGSPPTPKTAAPCSRPPMAT